MGINHLDLLVSNMNCKAVLLTLVGIYSAYSLSAQPKTDSWLKEYLYQHASPELQNVLNKPDSFQYQFIYTKIDRDSRNRPHFTNYYLNVDKDRYFNPASTVKLPLALLALQKLNELKIAGIGRETPMLTDSSYDRQTSVIIDTVRLTGFHPLLSI
jgi:hypothetical protein